jgi:hypothetical protein
VCVCVCCLSSVYQTYPVIDSGVLCVVRRVYWIYFVDRMLH